MSTLFHESDPSRPNRTNYTIISPTQIEATRTIRRLMDSVDGAFGGVDGYAKFSHPFWTDGAWHSDGFVEIYEAANVG